MINDEIIYENNVSEEISYYQNSLEVIDHTCDHNRNNLLNTNEETNIIWIHYINENIDISMNDDEIYP